MSKKYIGVTGLVGVHDLKVAQDCVSMMPSGWRFMAGLLVSAKTLKGEVPTRARYLPISTLRSMVESLRTMGAWPVAHFNTRSDAGDMAGELGRLMGLAPNLGGIQLNIVRPPLTALRAFKSMFPEVELIIQLNGSSVGRNPTAEDILTYAHLYKDVASHVLLDLSGGVGTPLNVDLAKAVVDAWDLDASLGVAGGLDATTVKGLAVVRGLHGESVSCDSESRLRTASDQLDGELARSYTRAAVSALYGPEKLLNPSHSNLVHEG